MAASVAYGDDDFKSGTSVSDLVLGRWNSSANSDCTISLHSTGGRFGGQSLRLTYASGNAWGYLQKTGIGNNATLCMNFPFTISALPQVAMEIASFFDGSTQQLTLVLNPSGTFSVYRGTRAGTLLATSSLGISANTYYAVEFKATFATGTGGTIEVRTVNGGVTEYIASTSGLNTSNSSNAYANGYALGQVTSTNIAPSGIGVPVVDYEHFLMLDDFAGDKRAYFQLPTANPTAAWTPLSSTNLSQVEEAQEDGDTSYVSSDTPGTIDWYTFAALPAGVVNIFMVVTSMWLRNDNAGTRQSRTKIKQSSTIVNGTTQSPSTSYNEYRDRAYTDPVSGIAFVKTDVDSLQNGMEMQT